MRIGIHDSDKTGFPNYALMKISAYHKAQGDEVQWWNPMEHFDKVYSCKVFTFTPEELMLPEDAIKGGTGYGMYDTLPLVIDNILPDYTLYPDVEHAVGFLTRGCIRKCPWCVVPQKEGQIAPYREWQDIKRPDKRDIVFMDNNVLASAWGLEQIEDMVRRKADVRIDSTRGWMQGL